jgi:subtilisin family serine protease
MPSDSLFEYDYGLPAGDDCWHLEKPELVQITRRTASAGSAEAGYGFGKNPEDCEIVDSYTRVGINARKLGLGNEGAGVKVAIFDTGVEIEHPSLAPNIDPDLAVDFDHTFEKEGLRLGNRGQIANRFNAHGTACAGLVGAVRPEASNDKMVQRCRVVGVAPKASLLPVRISTNFRIDCLINALRYAREYSDVILMARYLPDPDDVRTEAGEASVAQLENEIRETATRVPVVCASGNDGISRLVYPASLKETISVGACNDRGYRSTYSQFGDGLDCVAPSNDLTIFNSDLIRIDTDEADIREREREELKARLGARHPKPFQPKELGRLMTLGSDDEKLNLRQMGLLSIATTDNLGDFGYNFETAGDYCKATGDFGFGGTSAAAAQVAGVIALMLAENGKLKGRPDEVQRIVRAASSHRYLKCVHSDPVESDGSHDRKHSREFGYGLIDAKLALQLASEA